LAKHQAAKNACAEKLISRAVSIRSVDQAAEVESFASVFQKYVIFLAHPASDQEGRFAIVTDVGCGMRWTRALRETSAADADGKVVWSWPPTLGSSSRMMICE
jgi:hypothetical protein